MSDTRKLKFLLVKEDLSWPRSKGHDVHCYQMMRALQSLGHEISLITRHEPSVEAIGDLELAHRTTFSSYVPAREIPLKLSRLQNRFCSYWGVEHDWIRCVSSFAEECGVHAVVAGGMNILPYLGAVNGHCTIWYAGDELAWHHISQMKLSSPSSFVSNARPTLIYGFYERVFAPLIDRVWVVSNTDARMMRIAMGGRPIDVIPNGIDSDYFQPLDVSTAAPQSCVFWGRLDFGPNIQSMQWFCNKVWPRVLDKYPEAQFTIIGFNPTPEVSRLTDISGVKVLGNVPDLRPEVAKSQVVVMPMVSGWGIKNKLLEAAAMEMPIVGTPRSCNGLRGTDLPIQVAKSPNDFCDELFKIWEDPAEREAIAKSSRQWVTEYHSWNAAANEALESVSQWLEGRGK